MQAWLLRHARASWSLGAPDAERPLTPEGERDARRMGDWMAREGLVPDRVVSSPATRCLQTARLAVPEQEPVLDERIYEATLRDLFHVLGDASAHAERVLLVGHNPGLESLLRALASGLPPPTAGALMEPCTLARLEVEALRTGGGRLLDLLPVERVPSG